VSVGTHQLFLPQLAIDEEHLGVISKRLLGTTLVARIRRPSPRAAQPGGGLLKDRERL
jgi:hypothetical protein